MNTLLTGPERPEEQRVNDTIADVALQQLSARGLLPYRPFPARNFARVHQEVSALFSVEQSSITTRMARILYGISATLQPRTVLVIGSYHANALAWLAAPLGNSSRVVGVDLNEAANAQARGNLARIGFAHTQIHTLDGHEAHSLVPYGVDLLMLDTDCPVRGKQMYHTLLTSLYHTLHGRAIVLAHDACYPKFADDLAAFYLLVRDPHYFQGSVTLALDQFGLEVTVR